MPIINVKHASPLDDEQIDTLISRLTEVYASVTNAQPGSVQVLIEHIPAERWSIGGESIAKRRERLA